MNNTTLLNAATSMGLENVKCTKCGKKEIYIVTEKQEKADTAKTLDEYLQDACKPQTLQYRMTTYRCKNCGYSVSR